MRTPRRAAAASADTSATGVEMTSAHGTGDDEQHEPAIDPRHRRAPADERRHGRDERRQHDDDGRVDAREAIDEGLRRRALGLRGLDQVDDARKRRVADQPGGLHLDGAVPVDGAGEHLVARPLVHRQRLPGNRRLIDVARAGCDATIERDLLARTHAQALTEHNLVHGYAHLGAVAEDGGLGRREVHQGADGVARAVHAVRLEMLREREEKDHCRGFRPLPDGDRADDGNRHQDVHVERAVAEAHARPATPDTRRRRHSRQREHARRDRPAEPSATMAAASETPDAIRTRKRVWLVEER
jgi:hypothetical protein